MNIEVFSCSGGMAEGLRRAGVPIHMAFDFDEDACDSYEKNLGHRCDVELLSARGPK